MLGIFVVFAFLFLFSKNVIIWFLTKAQQRFHGDRAVHLTVWEQLEMDTQTLGFDLNYAPHVL